METSRSARAHIPALDGLRGLAVAAVLAYHLWPDVAPGGWLGVSLFFTLSGFLITRLLLDERAGGSIDLVRFWQRRVRRLLPAAFVTLAAVLIGTLIVDPDSVGRVVGDVIASVFYVQNWRAAFEPGGYDAIFDTRLRPLAHMWSLSVEEQVYLALPISVLVVGGRRTLLVGTVVAAIGYIVWWGSPDAYYATPVRFAEVLAGAAVAWWLVERGPRSVPPVAVAAAAAALTAGVFLLSESDPSVARGALLVAAVASATVVAAAATRPTRLLTSSGLRWLGRRSYAIYLAHWPVLVLTGWHPVVVLVVTLAIAELSHHVLEAPIRSGAVIERPLALAARASVALVAIALLAGLVARPQSDAEIAALTIDLLGSERRAAVTSTVPTPTTTVPPSTTTPGYPDHLTTAGAVVATTTIPVAPIQPLPPPLDPIPDRPTVVLTGDSTAVTLQPAVEGWVRSIGGRFVANAIPQCSPAFDADGHATWSVPGFGPLEQPCRRPRGDGADIVLVVDHGMPLFDHFDHVGEEWTSIHGDRLYAALAASYEAIIETATANGAIVVLTTPPTPTGNDTWDPDHGALDHSRLPVLTDLLAGLAAANDRVVLLDVGPIVDADPERYHRSDGLHLDTDSGAVNLVVDVVAPALVPGRPPSI